MWEIILGAVLTIVVAILAERFEGRKKAFLWATFIVLVIALAIVQIRARASVRRVAEAAEHRAEQLQADLSDVRSKLDSSRVELARVEGHLEGIQTVMENLSKSGVPGMKEFALALSGLSHIQQNGPAIERMSPKELTDKVKEFAAQMRNWATGLENGNIVFYQSQVNAASKAVKTNDRDAFNQLMLEQGQTSLQHQNAVTNEYNGKFQAISIMYRDELIRRLGPQPVETGPLAPVFERGIIAPESVRATALYLEKLANKLPSH